MVNHWTYAGDIISKQILSRGEIIRANLDLTTKNGAFLTGRIGRSYTTGFSCTNGMPGVIFFYYPKANGSINHPDISYSLVSTTGVAVVGNINYEAGYTSGLSTFVVDGTSLVPGVNSIQSLFFWGTGVSPTGESNSALLNPNAEWNRWAKGSATSLTVAQPTQYPRIDNEIITTQADIFSRIWLPGGFIYDVGFDYSDETAGYNIAVHAFYETYDYIGTS